MNFLFLYKNVFFFRFKKILYYIIYTWIVAHGIQTKKKPILISI